MNRKQPSAPEWVFISLPVFGVCIGPNFVDDWNFGLPLSQSGRFVKIHVFTDHALRDQQIAMFHTITDKSRPLSEPFVDSIDYSSINVPSNTQEKSFLSNISEWVAASKRRAAALGKIIDKAEDIVDRTERDGMLAQMMTSMGVTSSDVLVGVYLAMDIGEAFMSDDKHRWYKVVAKLGLAFVIKGGVSKIWNFMCAQVSRGITAQGPEDYVFAGITTIIMLAVGYTTGANEYDERTCKTVWDVMSKKGRDIVNIKSGTLAAMSIFVAINEIVVECAVGVGLYEADTRKSANKSFKTHMYLFSTKVNMLLTRADKSQMDIDSNHQNDFEEVVEHRSELNRLKAGGLIEREHLFAFSAIQRDYETCRNMFSTKYRLRSIKVDPPHVSFFGPPGIGKTSVIQNFTHIALRHFGQPVNDNIYFVSGVPKYFDGYKSQYVMIMDEKDAIVTPEAIALANEIQSGVPKILNMAAVEQKGRPFASNLIVSNTNIAYPQCAEAANITAYHRRRILVNCEPTAEFLAIPQADREKSIDNEMLTHLTFSVMKFTDVNIHNNQVPDPPECLVGLTFSEMLKHLLVAVRDKLCFQYRCVKQVEPDFPFEIPQERYSDVEVAIAEMVVERALNLDTVNYASSPIKSTLTRNEFNTEMRRIIEISKPGRAPLEQVRTVLSDDDRARIREKLGSYKQRVIEHTRSLLPQRQGQSDSEEYHTTTPTAAHRTKIPNVLQSNYDSRFLSECDDLYPEVKWESIYYCATIRGKEYYIKPTPEVSLFFLLNSRAKIVDCLSGRETSALGAKYKMDSKTFINFVRHQLTTVEEIDSCVMTDERLHEIYRHLQPTVEEIPCVIKPHKGLIEKGLSVTISSIKSFACDMFSRCPITIVPHTAVRPVGYDVNGTLKNIFIMIVGRVPGKFWVLPTAPVSYATLMSYDLESKDLYEMEARRTGNNRHGLFYFLQKNNNRMMDINNGVLDASLNNSRLCIEAFLFLVYGGHSMMSYVIGMFAAYFKKVVLKIYAAIQGHPKVALALGVLSLGALCAYMYKKESLPSVNAEGDALKIQGHDHRDVPDDNVSHAHIHQCLQCLNPFTHAHKKHLTIVSEKFPLYCRKCRIKLNKNANANGGVFVDEADAFVVNECDIDDTYMMEGGEEQIKPKFDVEIESVSPTKGAKKKGAKRIVLPKGESYEDVIPNIRFVVKNPESESVDPSTREIVPIAGIPKIASKTKSQGARSTLFPVVDKKMSQATVELDLCGVKIKGLVVGNRKILTFKHIIDRRLKTYGEIRATCMRMGREVIVTINQDNYMPLRDFTIAGRRHNCDLAIIDVRNQSFAPGPDLVKFFVKENTYFKANFSQGYLFGFEDQRVKSYPVGQVDLVDSVGYAGHDCMYNTGRTWRYFYPTSNGYCGSVIVFDNNHLGSSVIGGMHVCGGEGVGYSTIVTQEMLFDVIDEETFVTPECCYDVAERYGLELSTLLDVNAQQKDSLFEARGTACFTIGHLPKALRMPYVGDIKPSPLFDVWEHNLEPVALHKDDPRLLRPDVPASKASEKFVLETGNWNPVHIKSVVRYYVEKCVRLYDGYNDLPNRMLTEDEAINGIPGIIEALNMSTACGFPSEKYKGSNTGKKWLFSNVGTENEPRYVPTPFLRRRLDEAYSHIPTGVFVDNMIKDVMKVEKRKIERVQECETRLFNICDVVPLILLKRVAGVFVALQLRAKWEIDSTIGIDMTGFDVTSFINHIQAVGSNMLEGDFTGWDGRFDADTMKMCIDIVHQFNDAVGLYQEPFTTRRGAYTILHTAVYRFHIMGDVVYFIFVSMNSGVFVTSCWNSLGNGGRKRMVWYELVGELVKDYIDKKRLETMPSMFQRYSTFNAHVKKTERYGDDPGIRAENEFDPRELNTMRAFDEHVRLGCNGDDVLGCVSDVVKHVFNAPNIARIYATHGVLYTPPEKPRGFVGYEDDGFRTLEQVQFLKCNFRRDELHPYLIRAMMLRRTIEDLPAWVRESSDDRKACEDNISDAFSFAAHHGEEYFGDLRKRLRVACKVKNVVRIPLGMYEDYERRFYNNCSVFY